MPRFRTYSQILEGEGLPDQFKENRVAGSSLTIPGQGQDLAQILASIVKLPELDDRQFDSPAGVDPDIDSLLIKTELDSMYLAEGKNLAEDAVERQKARKKAKEEAEAKETTTTQEEKPTEQ